MEEMRHTAMAVIPKVLARWTPHARHDLVGACSPVSLDLSLLSAKSRNGPLTAQEIAPFVERGKGNIKNAVQQIDRLMLLLQQNRATTAAVGEIIEKMARSTRTVFAQTVYSPSADPLALGIDSEYDLTMMLWATIMALSDRYGANSSSSMQLNVDARLENDQLFINLFVNLAEQQGQSYASDAGNLQSINFDEIHLLAGYLGFELIERDSGIELQRKK